MTCNFRIVNPSLWTVRTVRTVNTFTDRYSAVILNNPLNARGLGERQKRKETLNWLRAKTFSIYLRQEMHCSENTTATWSSEWGYKTLFSCCSRASVGVAILFNNNFAFQLERSYSDLKGRFIICDIQTNGRLFTLATIYAHNDDDPAFFESFFSHLQGYHCDDMVLTEIYGDFNLALNLAVNLALNLEKDKKGGLACQNPYKSS